MQIQLSIRHGSLTEDQQAYLTEKAGKLLKYFDRLMAIEVEADHRKNDWMVQVLVSAEHKHDFVAQESASTPEAAADRAVQKAEQQIRRYKEKIQNHKDATPQGGTSPNSASLPLPPEPPGSAPEPPPAPEAG